MNSGFRVGFCVSGNGRLCRSAIRQRDRIGIIPEFVLVEQKASEDLERFCGDHDVRMIRLPKLDREAFRASIGQVLGREQVELLVLTFDRLLPPSVVDQFRDRIINLHPALLPAFPGRNALDQALKGGARFAGATMHEVAAGMDDGPIIAQCVTGIRADDVAATLGDRLFNMMRLMYLQTIAWYAQNRVSKNEDGRINVREAVYGELPFSPSIELSFPD